MITAADAAALELVPRDQLCTRTAWCIARVGHVGPCIEIARSPHVAPDFGPQRAVKR